MRCPHLDSYRLADKLNCTGDALFRLLETGWVKGHTGDSSREEGVKGRKCVYGVVAPDAYIQKMRVIYFLILKLAFNADDQ